jgi:hypothetical protein
MDFFDLSYLTRGSPIQQRGYVVLHGARVMKFLGEYDPVLAGTLPLDLFIDGSDLDIAGYASEPAATEEKIRLMFGDQQGYTSHVTSVRGVPTLLIRFNIHEFPVELFIQPIPTRKQSAYIHLVHEYRVLEEKGPVFREQVRELKRHGIKTEPAFARLLGLSGDPYDAMLTLY